MRFQVPQFIEVEDKIFGPLTFKQFIYLAGGVGICVISFIFLPKFLAILISLPVAAFSAALAFYKINSKPFINVVEAFVKYSMTNKLYIWKKEDKKPTPPKKEPEKKFDPSNIAALLDKAPDKAPKSTPLESTEDFEAPATDDPAAALTMSETDALRQRVEQCWNVSGLTGTADAEKLRATVRFGLNPDGSLAGRPTIVRSSGGSLSRLLAERAIQAVQSCAPYDFLPADKYTSWRDNTFNFDLGGMM